MPQSEAAGFIFTSTVIICIMNQVIAADSMISGNFENLKSQIPANIRECYYQSMTGGVTSKIEVANDLSDKKLNVSAYPSSNSWLEDHTAIFIADGHITDGDIGLHVSHLDDNGKNGRVIGLVGDDESERFGVPTADEIEKYVGEHGLPDFPELLGGRKIFRHSVRPHSNHGHIGTAGGFRRDTAGDVFSNG